MPSTSDNRSKRGFKRLVAWFKRIRRDGSEETKQARAYFRAAWESAKSDPSVFFFKFAADVVRSLSAVGAFGFIAIVLTAQIGLALEAPAGPIAGLTDFAQSLQTPHFIIGVVGLWVVAGAIGFAAEVTALAGIWGTFGEAARGRPVRFIRSAFSGLSRNFAAVVGLRAVSLLAQATVTLTGLSVVIAVASATSDPGWLAEQSPWLRALAWAAPLTLLSALALIVRITFEIAAAPLIIEGRPLGASLVEASILVTRRFVPIYRLLLVAATLLLVPLLLYWGLTMVYNIGLIVPELAPVLGLVRFVGDIIMFVAFGAITVLFYGALFFFYADERGYIDTLPGRASSQSDSTSRPGQDT